MKSVVGKPIHEVEGGVDVAVEVGGGKEEDTVDRREVVLVRVVVFIVDLGGLREVFWGAKISMCLKRAGIERRETLQEIHFGGDWTEMPGGVVLALRWSVGN